MSPEKGAVSPRHIQLWGAEMVVWLLSAVSFVDAADTAVLTASMIALEKDLGLSPMGLSMLYAGGGVSISICGIVWGILADRMSRKLLLVATCAAWGVTSILQAATFALPMLFALRWCQQALLSALGPISQSVIADTVEAERRGAMFGRLNMGGALGNLVITPLALTVVEKTIPMGPVGVQGWRFMLCSIGVIGCLTALALACFMEEPRREKAEVEVAGEAEKVPVKSFNLCQELARLPRLMRIPSFAVLLGQGLFGCVAWQSGSFRLVYLRLCGHSGAELGVMSIFTGIAGLAAAPISGMVPDAMARSSPAHGRACAAQVSVVLGMSFFVLWVVMSRRLSMAVLTVIMCFETLGGCWVTPGTKLPILSEIVPPVERATTMAWLVSMEGTFGGLTGPPIVGFLAERVFHYHPSSDNDSAFVTGVDQEENARALGAALLWVTVVPWLIQVVVFFPLLHLTYAKDVERATGRSLLDSASSEGEYESSSEVELDVEDCDHQSPN